jgi:hypothetical protein
MGGQFTVMAGTSGVSRSAAYSLQGCIQAHEFILFADAKIIASSELRSKSWAGTCVHSFIWLFFICHFLLTFEAKTNILLVIAVAGVSFRDLC